MRMLIQNKLKVAQNITLFNCIHKEWIRAFIYLKCASRQKLQQDAGLFSVGDLFHQKSFTLTCSQTFPGMSLAMAHGLSALKWRMRCWEPSLWFLHHPVTGLLFVKVSSHPTPPLSSCVQRSPGRGNGILPWPPSSHHSPETKINLPEWCPITCDVLSRDCGILFQPVAAALARDAEYISKITRCSVWKEKLQGLCPSMHLFIHTSHVQKTVSNWLLQPPFGDRRPWHLSQAAN